MIKVNAFKICQEKQNNHQMSKKMYSNSFSSYLTPTEKSQYVKTQETKTTAMKVYYVPPNGSGKRFARKNNSSLEKKSHRSNCSSNQSISPKPNISKDNSKPCNNNQKFQCISPSYVKLNNLLGVSTTPKHNKSLSNIRPLSSRTRQVNGKENNLREIDQQLRISEQKQYSRYSRDSRMSSEENNLKPCPKNNIAILRTQLQIKQKQITALEEERRKFRNNYEDLKRKHTLLQDEYTKYQKLAEQTELTLQEEITLLKQKITERDKIITQLKAENRVKCDELRMCQRDKQNISKQLSIFVQRRVPKDVRELQSWKQCSLQQQVNELKADLAKSRTDVEVELEETVERIRKQNLNLHHKINNLQLVQRLLLPKAQDSEKYFDAYIGMKTEYQNVRLALKETTEQIDVLRRQNVRLKKQMKTNKNRSIPKEETSQTISKSLLKVPSSTESLSLSLSFCSKD